VPIWLREEHPHSGRRKSRLTVGTQAVPGTGSGFIWRLFSISRFEERDSGVYVELEVMALSRCVPAGLRWLVNPVVSRLSQSSLVTSLSQTREAVKSLPQ